MPGSAPLLAVELGKLLEPLRSRLAAGQLAVVFEELGLPVPAAVANDAQVKGKAAAAGTALTALAGAVGDLAGAIASGSEPAIAQKFAALVPKLKDTFSAVSALAQAVKSAYSTTDTNLLEILAELPRRLLEHLVVAYLEGDRPLLARTLALLGAVESLPLPASGGRPAYLRRRLRLDRLATLLDDPALVLRELYRWGDAGQALDAALLLQRLRDLLQVLAPPAAYDPAGPSLATFVLLLRPAAGAPLPTPLDLTVNLDDLTGVDLPLPVTSQKWSARLKASGTLKLGTGIRIEPPAKLKPLAPTGSVDGEALVSLERAGTGGADMLLFGEPDGTRLTAKKLQAAVGAAFHAGGGGATAELVVDAGVVGGRLVVSFKGADGFLATFLPSSSKLDFDTGVRWTSAEGISLRGGAALSVMVPLTVQLGPLRLDRLEVGVAPGGDGLALLVRVTGGIALGPLAAAVEGVGVRSDLAFHDGSLGPVDLAFSFLPPDGLGLTIDAGPVKGGGFILFDQAAGRYAGVFQVSIGAIGVTAIGLLDTKLPQGATGFALLVVLHGEFPPIQLGFGFALTAVGGLLALNRRVDVDALRARFAGGTVGRILAPEDPIRNAPVLLADLGAVFPPAGGVVVVGPTLQLKWVQIVRFDVGVFIELPGPTKIVLLGSARAEIANPAGGKPLLRLRLDIIGLLDFARRVLEFDAVLIDSQLLGILEISGGVAFRLSWGDEPYVVFTVGGFHPAYSPAPLVFPPSLTRVAMTRGHPDDFLYFRFEGYFAITTNTLQFGAAIDVAVNAGPLGARGHLGFDALIRFKPFFFQFDFHASFKVTFLGLTLAGVSIDGTLSGPGPVTISGRFCIEILFFEICWSGSFSIGKEAPKEVKPVASAVAQLAGELDDPDNLEAAGGSDPWAVVEPSTAELPMPVVPPLGQVVWTQKRAPLDLLLQRFETVPLKTPETVAASGPKVVGKAKDWFAPGGFAELSKSQSLNRKAFERLHSGVRIGSSGIADGPVRTHDVTVDVVRLPENVPATFAFLLPPWLLALLEHRVGVFTPAPVDGVISVTDELWEVRGADGGVVVGGISQSQAHQLVAAGVGVAALPESDHLPSLPV
ncbi:MAG TPA: DUF6603 domain-containing protein [Actinomycetes bacterium]|nr:DUF6603 domain-containing protein [Actinomycetes bacterium]